MCVLKVTTFYMFSPLHLHSQKMKVSLLPYTQVLLGGVLCPDRPSLPAVHS